MAWMDQSRKKKLVALAKVVLDKYGVKATFSTSRSSICCSIKSGAIDFIGNYNTKLGNIALDEQYRTRRVRATGNITVNTYHIGASFDGVAEKFLTELKDALNTGNHDNSDISTDYFDVGWYLEINIGKWKKPYQYIPQMKKSTKVTNMRGPTIAKSGANDYDVNLFTYDSPTKTFTVEASTLGWAAGGKPPKHIMLKGSKKKVLYVLKSMPSEVGVFEFVPTKNSVHWTPACKDTVIKVINT